MKIYDLAIASDHAGVNLKGKIIKILREKGLKILNLGSDDDERVDYPDYAHKMVEEIIEGSAPKGILICGTGIGMSIAANRSSAIRAALCVNEYMAEYSRLHNNANVLVLGSKLVEDKVSLQMVEKFLETKFEGGRHSRRLGKIV
ncbi:MAG: ribose 5-phosphate isomerase B [Rickettsiaceae bacterium]|nr:ribose 5-phosphate isomerase B [Rickettsiaceae bacterium]MDP4832674.1 ribose 5-phosphate isomerase B [Rickettsiaceae bacterium]MDP5020944.1 ribose 5-phosphate isomerase B [Rickettsiaceae bacterium]MDP5083586.1 ribose 5-phosphate isomerase B [Rickettsiaceae bacterium]